MPKIPGISQRDGEQAHTRHKKTISAFSISTCLLLFVHFGHL